MAPFTFFKFVRDQRTPLAPVVKADLTGKTVVVTGASAGLGFEATKHFATMNPGRLILACRNQQKGEAAISDIQSSTGFSRMELWIIDLNDFTSVKTFADRFDNEGGRLDILVENAGISPMNVDERTKDGWLGVFQTNFIAPALLAYRLLPHMLKTAQDHSTTPRIVVVTSELHYWSTVHKNQAVINSPTPLKALSSQEYSKKASPDDEYMDSKLLNVLFVRDLQKRLLNPQSL
ncbi:hypothetical protein D9758_006116 [Tetrapyrgos nigripes]|uniref:NAD(P)-binding protein n=1 Tax=Tetrapyrgos nigripes TaxID=182062 RepID=A0A8H5FZW3_9AGAR|nr:hypothetical protein D9758_006116 [Tetrapyrgos nigripes]